MLVFDASKRITVDDALRHPFLVSLTRANPRFLVTKPMNSSFEKKYIMIAFVIVDEVVRLQLTAVLVSCQQALAEVPHLPGTSPPR